jgi:hypothetical protein
MSVPEILQRRSATTEEVLALFDTLPPMPADEMLGRWTGYEISTDHPMDGLLDPSGWYGKAFLDAETVHPLLLWNGRRNGVFSLHAVWARAMWPGLPRTPLLGALLRLARPLVGTTNPSARLREVRYRGVVTAAMAYDDLPIIDVFRKVDDGTVLGLMDRRGDARPYAFVLQRDDAPLALGYA